MSKSDSRPPNSNGDQVLLDLAESLRALVIRQPPPDDEEARHTINSVIVQAMRRYKKLAADGVGGFKLENAPIDGDEDVESLHRCWREKVIPDLQRRYPTEVPDDPMVEAPKPLSASDIYATHATSAPQIVGADQPPSQPWPFRRWRRRAETYATIIDLLAGKHPSPLDKMKIPSRPMTKGQVAELYEKDIRTILKHPAAHCDCVEFDGSVFIDLAKVKDITLEKKYLSMFSDQSLNAQKST